MAAPITAHSTTQITECVGGITHMFPNPKLKQLFFWTIELLALSLLVYIVSAFGGPWFSVLYFKATGLTDSKN